MATSSSSSGPSLIGRKRRQTIGDLIVYSLENLKGCDFNKLKNKLSDFSYEDKLPIPRGRLENADCIITKDALIDTYGGEGALNALIEVFTLIGLMGPANDLQNSRAENAKAKKMKHDNRLTELAKEYRESTKGILQRTKEYNSRMGEAINLQKRYTKLFMRNGPPNKKEKEQEIRSTGRRHLQVMEKRSSDEYSPTTIQALFDPDEDGCIPNIVVLQGPAGIGKTMTSKKIMLDWTFGNLYQDKFDFVFYLSCREINTINRDISIVDLLFRTCKLQCLDDLVSILKDPESHRKLLFIVDGFDELRWTVGEESEACDVFEETHKEIILQRLLRKQIFQQSSLIITTRSLAINKLDTFIDDSRNVEIQGFTREDREEYVHKFFGNKEDAEKVLSIIKDNEVLYTMCAVPIICWIACTVMKQIKKDLGLIQFKTMTSIYLLYLEVLITHHSNKDPSEHWKPQAIHTCLKKLCALANEGILNQQILFENKDLERHGLSLSEVESVFLNENIFDWEVRTQTCYSFIHLSVQEFLAALYYVLDDGSGFTKSTFLPGICKGKSLDGFSSGYPHLTLAVQFLFGLLNEKQVTTFSESTGINISLQTKTAMKEWAIKDIDQYFPTHSIFCLYETQEEDFVRSIMSCCSSLNLYTSRTNHLWMDSHFSQQLSYCLMTLKSECFQSLNFNSLTVDPECQKRLSPFLHRCQELRFQDCIIYSKDCPGEDNAEDEEESSSSEDEMGPATLSWLINPESKIQILCLNGCGLTSSCCDDLLSILLTNRSLSVLELSRNNLQDSGIKLLCEGLMHPGCRLQELSVRDCKGTFLCSDDICSVIITNRTLTRLKITLDVDKKMSNSEVAHHRKIFRKAGFFGQIQSILGDIRWIELQYIR